MIPRPSARPTHRVDHHNAIILQQLVTLVEEGAVGVPAHVLLSQQEVALKSTGQDKPRRSRLEIV